MAKRIKWTEEMDKILRNNYVEYSNLSLATIMGFNHMSVRRRLIKLELVRKQQATVVRIKWTPEMISKLKLEFPYKFNKVLANELGMGWRTLVRKARELGVNKEEDFLDVRRKKISKMAWAALQASGNRVPPPPPNENFFRHCFKKGNISPMVTSQKVRDKTSATRLKLIADEKHRIINGEPQLTKIKLKVWAWKE